MAMGEAPGPLIRGLRGALGVDEVALLVPLEALQANVPVGLRPVLLAHGLHLRAGEGVLLLQPLRQRDEQLAVLLQPVHRLRLRRLDQRNHLLQHHLRRLGGDVGDGHLRAVGAEVHLVVAAHEADGADALAEAEAHHHLPRDQVRVRQVRGGRRAHQVLPQDQLLRRPPRQAHHHLRGEVAAGHDARLEVALLRHEGGVAGGAPAGEHRHLLQVVEVGREVADERAPGLVQADGGLQQRPDLLRVAALPARRLHLLAPRGDGVALELLEGVDDVALLHVLQPLADGGDGRLVHQVHDVRPRPPRAPARDALPVHVAHDRLVPRVHLQNLDAALDAGQREVQDAVEAAGAGERLVQHRRAVGGRQHHDARVVLKAVHLRQHLVDGVGGLLPAHHAAAGAQGARRPERVELVDEDDAGRRLARHGEEVAHARRPHAHKHLHELRPRAREEGHLRLARDRLRQQRLARAGGAHQERPLRHLAAQVLVLPRVLQEAHELHHLRLRLVAPGHVLEHHLGLGVLVEGADRRLAHGEDAAPPAHAAAAAAHAAAHLAPREPQPPREEEQGGRQADHLRLPAHLRGVHHRQVAARVDAHDVLRLLQLALEGLDAANVEEELVGGLAVGVGDEAHLARGAVGANVHLGNRLVQDLDFLNHTLLEELVLEFLEADFLCFRTIQEERHRGETKESPCYQQLLCRLVCQNIAEALSLLLSPWWCLIWFLLAATIGALVLGIKVLEAVLLGCVRESATERPWGRLGPDLRQFWKLPHHVRPTGKRCQSATGKRARSCSSVLHPS
mmetsp:Transcript_34585/g.75599  ORF Transcript_34585/g.75599 Transcript_34585/m.75599 type:complete len:792 (-) Transcript_34585:480-2855(-)